MSTSQSSALKPRMPFERWLTESYTKYETDGPVWERDWQFIYGRLLFFPIDFAQAAQELARLIEAVKKVLVKARPGSKAFRRYQWMYYTLMKPGGLEIAPNCGINKWLRVPRLGPFGLRMELDAVPYLSFVRFSLDSNDLAQDDEIDAALTEYAVCLAGRQNQQQRDLYINNFRTYVHGRQSQLTTCLNTLKEMTEERTSYERAGQGETADLTDSVQEFLKRVPQDLRQPVANDRAATLLTRMTIYRRNAVSWTQEKAMAEELIKAVQYLSSIGDDLLTRMGQVGFSTG